MSDIEELLRTLGSHTDHVEPRPPSLVRRAGAKRQRRRRVAWGSVLVLACVAAGGGIVTLIDRAAPPIISPTPPPTPPPSSSSIVPLHQIGPGIAYGPGGLLRPGESFRPPRTMIRQNRAFAIWQQSESALTVGAVDLATGKEAWRHQEDTPGEWLTLTGSNEVLLCVHRKKDLSSDQTVVAFDVGDGAVLWRFAFSGNLLRFGNTVVVEKDQSVIGLDMRTGREQWTLDTGPGDRTFMAPMRSSMDASNDPFTRQAEGWTDHRLVTLNPDGLVRIVNTDKGTVTLETTIALKGGIASLDAADGSAIIADHSEVRLISSENQSVVYAARDGRRLVRAGPCDTGRLCITEQAGKEYDVTVLEVAGRRPLWLRHSTSMPFTSASAGYYFISTDSELRVFDGQGAQVTSYDTGTETPLVLSPDLVVRMQGGSGGDDIARISFAIGSLTSTSSIPIGELNVFAYGCTPTTSTLVCPTETGVMVWRFVN